MAGRSRGRGRHSVGHYRRPSLKQVHAAIIDVGTFAAAQQVLAGRRHKPAQPKVRRTPHRYALRGILHCGLCDRRMQGHRAHDAAYYRCRYPQEYGLANRVHHPSNVYLREDAVLPALDGWLAQAFAPSRLADTIDAMAGAQDLTATHDAAEERLRKTIADCDAKIVNYRAALDAGADPAVVSGWIVETRAERVAAEQRLGSMESLVSKRMSRAEIAALVSALGDIRKVISDADPADKAEVYRQLGLHATYDPGGNIVRAEAKIPASYCGVTESVRGGT